MSRSRSIRAILFDAGGTLIHFDGERACRAAGLDYRAESFAEAEAAAVALVRRWVRKNPQSTDAERLPLFLDAILTRLGSTEPGERRSAHARIIGEHRRANLWSRRGEGALETLRALCSRGYRLGVVSNADGRVRALLEGAGLTPYLEIVLDSAEVGVEKPDAGIFLAAVGRLGLAPSECAYIGDIYEIDVLGAEGAGLSAVMIGPGPAPAHVTRVGALPDLLDLFPSR